MSTTDQTTLTSDAIGGAVGGAVAYVLGYLFVYATQSSRVEEQLRGFNFFADLFGGDPIPTWKAVGWTFYNSHFVDTQVPALIGGAQSISLISQAEGGSLTFLYVIPPVLLLLAGLVAARSANATEPADGARAGALVLAGYLPLVILGALLFRYAAGDGAVAPDIITAVLLAGAVYPAVFGGIGGAVASVLGD